MGCGIANLHFSGSSQPGSSQEDALRSFTEDFAVLWEEIAQAPDAELTDDAIRLKYALRNIVESVDVTA